MVNASSSPSRREIIRSANEQARAAILRAPAPAQGSTHLGDLVWWDPSEGWTQPAATVAATFRACGLDPAALLPPVPGWSQAFGRAVQSLRTSIRPEGFTFLDATPGEQGEHRVAVVRVERGHEVKAATEGLIACPPSKNDGAPFVERPDANGIVYRVINETRSYHEVYTSDDVRAAIVSALNRWSAMPCRQVAPHVIYWVPPGGADEIRKLADAVEACGWGRIELFAGYSTDSRSARACVNAVNGGLEASLKGFADEARAFASKEPERVRVSTIENKIADAARLRERAAFYKTILGAAVTSIDDRVSQIEAELQRVLGVVSASKK